MAGDWIKVEKSSVRKPEVLKIARMLGVSQDHALGLLVRFWCWLDDNCVDGVVDGVVDADVDALLSCPGLSSLLTLVGWVQFSTDPAQMRVLNFDRHNGETSKNRALRNARQAKWRNANVDAPPSTKASTREEKRREEKSNTKAKAPARKRATPIPDGFTISQRVRDWAAEKGYQRLDQHLEAFVSKVAAKGYTYLDWDAAFMNCIREDWGRVNQPRAVVPDGHKTAAHMPARLPPSEPKTNMPQHIGTLLAQFKQKAVA